VVSSEKKLLVAGSTCLGIAHFVDAIANVGASQNTSQWQKRLRTKQWRNSMKNLIFGAINRLVSLLKGLQVKQLLTVVFVGFLLLTSNVDPGKNDQALPANLRDRINQNDADRPKTTGQWNREAREVEGNPGERFKRIGKETGEAFKEFGSGYVKGAEKTANDVQNGVDRAARDLAD
jgi:hypothetical protein